MSSKSSRTWIGGVVRSILSQSATQADENCEHQSLYYHQYVMHQLAYRRAVNTKGTTSLLQKIS